MYTSIINLIKFNIFKILSSSNGSIAESLSADESLSVSSLSVLVSDLLKKIVSRKVVLKKNCLQRHIN